MVTKSLESSYTSPAAKRACYKTLNPLPQTIRISRIESLPTEILQLVFFAALNGNLLRAAARIAAKLSGSRNIYRTAFFTAFYHPHIVELCDAFKFDYLVPHLEVPIASWELRSMQKIVLDSRWCTFGWFKGQASELLDYAHRLYRDFYATDIHPESLQRLECLLHNRGDPLALRGAATGAMDSQGHYVELVVDSFDLSINVWAEDEGENHLTEVMCEKARRWHLQLCGVGSRSMRLELLRNSYNDDEPFRLLVKESALSVPCIKPVRSNQVDKWECIEKSMLYAIDKHELNTLRDLLDINYFYWPEDAPFKIPPRMFVAAARAEDSGALQLLFQADPTSVPRQDKHVRRVARFLRRRSASTKEHRLRMRMKRRQHKAKGRVYSAEAQERVVRLDSWQEYTEQYDEFFEHFVRTGCLLRKVDPLSPNFALRTHKTPVREDGDIEIRLFGLEDEPIPDKRLNRHCDSEDREEAEESDLESSESSDDSDVDDWIDSDEIGTSDDSSAPSEDDYSVAGGLLDGLDWLSVLSRVNDDILLQRERREDYHYMMP
jgi:hypothetical protein